MGLIENQSNFTDDGLSARKWFRMLREMRSDESLLYEDARFVVVDLPLRRDAVRKILPRMLWQATPTTGTLIVADYPRVSGIESYREALLLVRVQSLFGSGVHCCWIVLDDDTAIFYGREFAGYPKKSATIDWSSEDGNVSATVARRGVSVIELEARCISQAPAEPLPVFELRHFNAGGLGQWPGLIPIWCFKPEETIKETRAAEVSLILRDSRYPGCQRHVRQSPSGN